MKRIFLSILLIMPVFMTSCSKTLFRSAPLDSCKYPVYVLTPFGTSLLKIDGERDEVIDTFTLPTWASTFSVAPNGTLVVAVTGVGDLVSPYKNQIHVLSPDGKRIGGEMKIKNIPDNMYLKNNRIAAVTHNTALSESVSPFTIIDLEKREEIRFELPGFVNALKFEDDSILLYITTPFMMKHKLGLYRLNLADRSITEVMEMGNDHLLGGAPVFHNNKLYGIRGRKGALIPLNQTLQVIDIESKKVEKVLPLSDSPYSLAFVEDKIYVTHFSYGSPSTRSENKVSIIDSKTYEIEDVLEVGRGPAGICYSKSLGKVYTANVTDDSVTVIDPKTRKVIKTILLNTKRGPAVIRCPE